MPTLSVSQNERFEDVIEIGEDPAQVSLVHLTLVDSKVKRVTLVHLCQIVVYI